MIERLDEFLEANYRRELLEHCGRFFQAIQPVASLLNDLHARQISPDDPELGDRLDAFWLGIMDAMTQAGMISKILFPAWRDYKKRGGLLRASIGIEDDSPLKDRSVRDAIEHYDERLQNWHQSSRDHNIVNRWIGLRSGINMPDAGMARWYDPGVNRLHIFESSVDFQELTRVVAELQRKLVEQHAAHPGDLRYG